MADFALAKVVATCITLDIKIEGQTQITDKMEALKENMRKIIPSTVLTM